MKPVGARTTSRAPTDVPTPAPERAFAPAVVIGALGVVFGDIGTSPIYTTQTVFNPDDPHPVAVSPATVLGVTSLIFWSVMIISRSWRRSHVTARFGYKDDPNVPAVMRQLAAADTEFPIEPDGASYFLSTIELRHGAAPTMAPWRKRLFLATARLAADAAEFFGLPRDRTVIVGSQIDV